MYSLTGKLTNVVGIGQTVADRLASKNLHTIYDLLLWAPLHYEDRSQQKLIMDLVKDELVTIQADVTAVSNQYRGRRSIQRATIQDNSGSLKLIWFNSPYIKDTLKRGQSYFFSGQLNNRRMMTQPKIEKISRDTIHTNRLVPIYSTVTGIKPGNLRRYLKEIVDHLQPIDDPLAKQFDLLPLNTAFKHLHFPDDQQLTIDARKRLALEELLGLMQHSYRIKQQWKDKACAHFIKIDEKNLIPKLLFTLTHAQQRSLREILVNIQSTTPMNRLLLGDVGSGKTVVAGIAAWQVLQNNHHVAFIVPTQILAQQHLETLDQFFPEINTQLLTAKNKFILNDSPTIYIGTHAVINKLQDIKPALIIYDEQHRFGVKQRSEISQLAFCPHLLTMSATPIPRSLMLTIFSHLELSVIDEMPAGRKPVKTWLIPEKKRTKSYNWIKRQLQQSGEQATPVGKQVLVICPFIDPSDVQAFANIKSATQTYETLKTEFADFKVELLHSRLSQAQKDHITQNLYNQKIDILVCTSIVEVGVDLPTASIILIESAERFGLASLHQLRGRVGRAGQQAHCLLFSSVSLKETNQRLEVFTQTTDGMKLAEADLQNRGAGDLFGTQQHGFDQLKFANWTNVELITQARRIFDQLKNSTNWQPLISPPATNSCPNPN
ncbi:ATP-dependent DNA helicase RecG [Patescibacteria group bacterium]|nr:ATP-dependent DNA helicase RecG [Patescibacteria group bacterium]